MPVKPPIFRPQHIGTTKESSKVYELERGSPRQRGYTPQWDKTSVAYRIEHPLCCGCLAMGMVEVATVVDHIEPHQGDQAKFWDETNWQSSCTWHHSKVKQQLEALWFEGAITLAELRLDSPKAVRLARCTPRKAEFIGLDGW